MIAGHTRFSPDCFFGLIKKSYVQTSVSTLCDIEKVMNASTTGGRVLLYLQLIFRVESEMYIGTIGLITWITTFEAFL